jgi:hypothetical protein
VAGLPHAVALHRCRLAAADVDEILGATPVHVVAADVAVPGHEPELLNARSRELSVTRWPRAGSLTMRDSAFAGQTRSCAGHVKRTVQPSMK